MVNNYYYYTARLTTIIRLLPFRGITLTLSLLQEVFKISDGLDW